MHMMAYGAMLPADYEMARLRERVRQNGRLLDDRRGLGFKAYLMRERGRQGSPINYYGSFYIWNDSDAVSHFLVGGGAFERIIAGLGRLSVEYWIGLAAFAGKSLALPTLAFRSAVDIPFSVDVAPDGLGVSRFVDEQRRRLIEYARRSDLHTCALALDPRRWSLVIFAAGADTLDLEEADTDRFEVLHVSQPERGTLLAVDI